MSDTIKKLGFTAEVVQDEHVDDPRDWDNVTRMWFYHGRYQLGDYNDPQRPSEPVRCIEDIEAAVGDKIFAIKPVYMYDHSGLTIKTSPFSCPWDSGQIGFVFITAKMARKESGRRLLVDRVQWALEMIEAEIETYDQMLTGDVYSVVVKDRHGNEVESCWGFFGRKYAEQEAQIMLDKEVTSAGRKWRERLVAARKERKEQREWECRC